MAECIKELFLEVLRCGRRYSSLHLYLSTNPKLLLQLRSEDGTGGEINGS